ncbi:hypothetical protein ACFWVT_20880 [Streptomyces cyaneofuscatus]|uniref:hypothetical protein n=1 Tax=Streptomyces cyaneofuscatus TaxID=66883 RepID=UPI00364F1135
MGEQRSVRNEFSGEAYGPVVQAGKIGRVVFNPPPPGLSAEDLALYQRLLAREAAKANAEDAAALALQAEAAERVDRMSKARRRRWWYFLLVLLCAGAGVAYMSSKRFSEVPSSEVAVLWIALTAVFVMLTARTSYEARTGHRLPWSVFFR